MTKPLGNTRRCSRCRQQHPTVDMAVFSMHRHKHYVCRLCSDFYQEMADARGVSWITLVFERYNRLKASRHN